MVVWKWHSQVWTSNISDLTIEKYLCQPQSSQFYPCHQPRPKMVKEHRQTQKFLGANEVRQHAPQEPSLFSFGEGGGLLDIFGIFLFSICSCQVPNGFPTCSPKFSMLSPTFSQQHLTLSHKLCPKLSSWNLYKVSQYWYFNVSMFGVNTSTWGRLQTIRFVFW